MLESFNVSSLCETGSKCPFQAPFMRSSVWNSVVDILISQLAWMLVDVYFSLSTFSLAFSLCVVGGCDKNENIADHLCFSKAASELSRLIAPAKHWRTFCYSVLSFFSAISNRTWCTGTYSHLPPVIAPFISSIWCWADSAKARRQPVCQRAALQNPWPCRPLLERIKVPTPACQVLG